MVEEFTEEPIITVEEPVEFLTGILQSEYTWTNQDKEQKVPQKQPVFKSIRKNKLQTLLHKDRKANTKKARFQPSLRSQSAPIAHPHDEYSFCSARDRSEPTVQLLGL